MAYFLLTQKSMGASSQQNSGGSDDLPDMMSSSVLIISCLVIWNGEIILFKILLVIVLCSNGNIQRLEED